MHEKPFIISADDDADDQDFLEEALKDCIRGAHVFERVSDGEKLLQRLDRILTEGWKLPDVILLDLNMPVKSGKEVLKIMNADPVLKQIPVVVLTTSSAPVDKNFSSTYGAEGFLVKPNSVGELSKILHPALEKYCQ